MKIPAEPPVGHLVAYEYLWSSKAGVQEHGEKTYPAAIILAREGLGSAIIAYALGISHSPPQPGQRALPVPPKLKRWLGLDVLPSWITQTRSISLFGLVQICSLPNGSQAGRTLAMAALSERFRTTGSSRYLIMSPKATGLTC